MEEIIRQLLNFLEEGKNQEAQELLLRNINLFSKETQIEILSSIIEGKILEKTEQLKKINSSLKKILEDLKQNKASSS